MSTKWTWKYTTDLKNITDYKNIIYETICVSDDINVFNGIHNIIKGPDMLSNFSDYSIFKDNIQPCWEDINNKNGSRIMILLSKNNYNANFIWINITNYIINSNIKNINGVVINIREKVDKIGIWLNNNITSNELMVLKKDINDILFEFKYTRPITVQKL